MTDIMYVPFMKCIWHDMTCTQHVWDDIYVTCMMWCVTWHITCVTCNMYVTSDTWWDMHVISVTCDLHVTTYTTWDDMTCMRGDMQHVMHVTTCITWNSYDNMRCGDATHVRWWHTTHWDMTICMTWNVTCNMRHGDMQHTWDMAHNTWLMTCMWCAMCHDLCDIRYDVCQKQHVACYSYVTHVTLDMCHLWQVYAYR